jgi:hypothetical protein
VRLVSMDKFLSLLPCFKNLHIGFTGFKCLSYISSLYNSFSVNSRLILIAIIINWIQLRTKGRVRYTGSKLLANTNRTRLRLEDSELKSAA